MRLSIIVPVYNVEQYIVKCIESLLVNATDDYEIVIVNDGTKDHSIDLVREHFHDPKIRIVEQENQGLSVARNTGVAEAKGDYLWFVDSDDWVEPNSVDIICEALSEGNIDVLYQASTFVYQEGERHEDKRSHPEGVCRGAELLLSTCPTCAQFYIVERSFWLAHQFAFYPGILHEDNELMFKVVYKAERIKCLDMPLYYHNLRPGSITQTFNPKRCYSLRIVLESMFDFMEKEVRNEDRKVFAPYILDALYAMLDAAKEGDASIKHDINAFLSEHRDLAALLWTFGDLKARIFYMACKLSQGKYVQTCALFRKFHK